MESDTREEAWLDEPGNGRALNGERSPGGSVKRARERAAAALPPDAPPLPLNPRSNPTSPHRQSPRQSPQYQSPHRQSPRRSPRSPSSPAGYPSPPARDERGPAPQRPPRPTYVPPLLQNPPPVQQPRNYWEEGHDSYLSGYSSGSSRPSTIATGSSTASIPDFPQVPPILPSYQPPPRRNLGPPPSARRGISSYYSHNSFVPPIPEENSEKHSSYASSGAMPESWEDGPPQYYMGQGISEEDEEDEEDDLRGGQHSEDSSGRGSKASDYGETSNLVRGPPRTKPLQPFMEPIESGDETASQSSSGTRGMRELDWQQRQDERFRGGFGGPPGTDAIGRHNFKTRGNLGYPYSGYESDATFLDSPRSASPPMPKAYRNENLSNPYFSSPSSPGTPVDPRVGQILGNLEKGGALPSSGTVSPGSSLGPSRKQSLKRPPPLNLESPGKIPGRGSQSSLPELIRRATRLASNLDRGKTASRVGMLDVLNKKDMEKQEEVKNVSRDGSISDMLAAFPSPSPTVSTMPSKPPIYGAPSPHGKSNLSRAQTIDYGTSRSHSHRTQRDRGRRCCGMPLWGFVCLVIILMLLVALAVVIPITLIVIPRQNESGPTIESCQNDHPCANGGHTLVVDKGCRCICTGRFYGDSCNTPADGECTTKTLPLENNTSGFPDATLGTSIPRILDGAQTNYSIPLSGWKLAALFSHTNLSCTSENSLITFDGQSQKRKHRRSFLPRFLSRNLDERNPENEQDPPDILLPTKTLAARASAQSSNGIVFDSGSGPGNVPSAPPIDPSSSDSPSSNTSSPAQNTTITPALLDFARTAVLFIFQETSDLAIAQQAMTRLAGLLVAGEGGTYSGSTQQIGVTGNVSVDLGGWTVGMGNGTLYGGRGTG